MKIYYLILIIIISFFSCDVPEKQTVKKVELKNIYSELEKDSVYKIFIGYHIVRRDNENYFMYRNLMTDSSDFVVPNLTINKEKEAFFTQHPNARFQFDIMRNLDIKAVTTMNYDSENKRLEYSYSVGYDFTRYELSFILSDSIEITHINFDTTEYYYLIKNAYNILYQFSSNWFVLKR